jgi:hypothetical protein
MKRSITIITIVIIMSSCGVSERVVTRQKSLMDQHQAKKQRPKPGIKKQKQALTISVFVALLWYGLYQGSNIEGE